MGFTALEETEEDHDQVHPVASPDYPVASRSSLNSECSSLVRFSGFSSVPTGACMFSLVMLALILTWPSDFGVGAVNFTFNGFKENDVFSVSDSSWILDSSTSCIYFDPPNASGSISVAGRFLNRDLVQMRDPVSKKVKSFSTTFICQIWVPPGNHATGPGMAFIIVPDNVTLGAPGDCMGLLTATPKNFESNDHTFGVELDTYMNLEFNDPSENHIGINPASMNSTYTCKPDYDLASKSKNIYQQIWIDYFEPDSHMDISYAYYGQGKPGTPQGFQRGLDLSFFEENMYIGFSSAKGKESDNLPYFCAWSFSNDGLPAPPIVVGRDVPPASPSSSPGQQPPAPAPVPRPISFERMTALIGSLVSLFILVLVSSFCCSIWVLSKIVSSLSRVPLRVFISDTGGDDGFQKNFPVLLRHRLMSRSLLNLICRIKRYFIDHSLHREVADNVLAARLLSLKVTRCDVGIVVVSKDLFRSIWAMRELVSLTRASKNVLGNRVQILPLFFELTPDELRVRLELGTWERVWEEMPQEYDPPQVKEYREAVRWLCTQRGITYGCQAHEQDKEYTELEEYKEYTEDAVKAVCRILYEEWCYRSFPSSLRWVMDATAVWGRKWGLAGVGKRSKRAKAAKEIGVMTYIQKLLHLLFALSGQLVIFCSVILDNSFNHQPQRFIAFAILAPVMIFLGILVSGWFPRIPLWLIACLKRRGFLKHVSACSPWHDNVVIDFCGEICTLESLEEADHIGFLELHQPLLRFLHGSLISPEGSTLAPESQDFQGAASTLEPEGECLHQTSTLQPQNEDWSTYSNQDYKDAGTYGIFKIPPITMVKGLTPLPKFQNLPSPGEDFSSKFHVLDKARQPTLTIEGPMINGCILEVQIFRNTSSRDPTFDLTCTFRNKRTRKFFLTTQKVQNLARNMYRWVESPHPIATNESSDILHCLAIQDILSEFTKGVYSFKPFHVQHRYLAGFWEVRPWINFSYGALCSFLSLFPLLSSERSYYFLFSLFVVAPYLFISKDTNPLIFYNLRELLCPVFIHFQGFRELYLSRSWFRWCNEFRKQRVVNPDCFLIDANYSNNFSDGESCFDVCGFVDIPDTPIIKNSIMTCQGRVDPRDPTKRLKQHNYKLDVDFDKTKPTLYTNVTLFFCENNDILVRKHYSFVEIKRLYLIQQLFHYYTYSSFGGYVEKICPGVWPETYLAHSPRFLDICHKIISESSIPTFLMAKRVSSSKFIIGVPF